MAAKSTSESFCSQKQIFALPKFWVWLRPWILLGITFDSLNEFGSETKQIIEVFNFTDVVYAFSTKPLCVSMHSLQRSPFCLQWSLWVKPEGRMFNKVLIEAFGESYSTLYQLFGLGYFFHPCVSMHLLQRSPLCLQRLGLWVKIRSHVQ